MSAIEEACDAMNSAYDRFEDIIDERFRGVDAEVQVNEFGVQGAIVRRKVKAEWGLWWHGVGTDEFTPITGASILCRVAAAGAVARLVEALRIEQAGRLGRIRGAAAAIESTCKLLEMSL